MSENPDIRAFRRFLERGEEMEVHSSPLLAALKCRLVAADAETVTLRFDPPEMFRQGAGVVQGVLSRRSSITAWPSRVSVIWARGNPP